MKGQIKSAINKLITNCNKEVTSTGNCSKCKFAKTGPTLCYFIEELAGSRDREIIIERLSKFLADNINEKKTKEHKCRCNNNC